MGKPVQAHAVVRTLGRPGAFEQRAGEDGGQLRLTVSLVLLLLVEGAFADCCPHVSQYGGSGDRGLHQWRRGVRRRT